MSKSYSDSLSFSIAKSSPTSQPSNLEYCGSKKDFTIVSSIDELLGDILTAKDEHDEIITFVVVGGRFKDVETAEQGISNTVSAIASYAHSRY